MPTEQRSKCALAVSDALIVEPLRLGKRQELQGKQDGELEAIDHETPDVEQDAVEERIERLGPGLARPLGNRELMEGNGGGHDRTYATRICKRTKSAEAVPL